MKKSSTNVISMSQDIDLVCWEPGELHDLSFSAIPSGLSVNSSPNGKSQRIADAPTPPTEQISPNNMTWAPWEPKDLSIITRRPPQPEPAYAAPEISSAPIEEDTRALDRELAARILSEARLKSADLLHNAKEEATAITLRAHLEGQSAAEAEAATLLKSASAIVEEMEEWRESLLSQSEPMVLALVEDIARTMFGKGFELAEDKLQEVFKKALTEAKNLGDIRIHVHPEDAALLGPHWDEQQSGVHNQNVELVPDEQIKRGGCLITGTNGSVDARLENQLETVVDTLRQTLTEEKDSR